MVMHLSMVEKSFSVPHDHLKTVMDVYGMLNFIAERLPAAIYCKSFQVMSGPYFQAHI